MFFDKFSEITEDDIIDLINNKIPEQKTLEYKRQLPDKGNDLEKVRILQCITSFANTDGGVIVFGLSANKEDDSIEITGIDTPTDSDFLFLQNMVKDRIVPRMNPPDFRDLKINDKKVYLMKVYPSYTKPHFVSGNFVFYGRNSSGKYPLDITDIKNLFLQSKNVEEQFENFRIQRIMKLKSGSFPFQYNSNHIITLHIASLSSLNNDIQLSMSQYKQKFEIFKPMCYTGYSRINNYDGCLNYCHTRDNKMYTYVQIFRNGIIEASLFDFYGYTNEKIMYGIQTEQEIKKTMIEYINALETINIKYPMFISLSFLNTKDFQILITHNNIRYIHDDFYTVYEDDLLLPTMFIENKDDLDEKFKSCFDIFWNSNGYAEHPNGDNYA
jgi:hypothetical protein